MSPKKSPWSNLCEFLIGDLKGYLRKREAQTKPQVLKLLRQRLSSMRNPEYEGLLRTFLRENLQLVGLLEKHILSDIYWRRKVQAET